MAEMNRRARQRNRHRGGETRNVSRAGRGGQTEFASFGEERGRVPGEGRREDVKSRADREEGSAEEISRQENTDAGFGKGYGQGFGVGAGHGAEGVGSPRERQYRGEAGTTFGAVVGPDALKSEEADKRGDEKPGQ